ncbi:zinc finger protein 449 isoform X11 [Etheostoma spectabile]|uniref:zinc finger protein 449 isoform X11 n=1 Tax=Etheostoma spectabile TaxID=54343 RepID=UPI0013AED0A7|nr:zinc finger protein 449-like isoform X11 [Etheostoma spectabile]
MCKVQMLRALVEQRLTAAAEEIFGLFERTIAEYEEELCRSKEENERQRELLDAVFNPQLRVHRAVIKEDEPEAPPHIKEEEEELFPFTPVPVEREEDEEKGRPQRQAEHTKTETEDSVDSDFWKETREPQSSLNSLLKDEEVPVSEERRKTDKKSLGCSECGKRFGAVGDLNRHMRIHTGEKPFSCSVCCRRFLSSTHLKTHMRTHTGEKPFSCLFCDKRFRHSGNLTAHMNIHTGEKRFSCSVCDKTFTWRQQVKKHKCVQSPQLHRRQSDEKTADF